jgi:glycosyltransferase involved in cell wall biosynthesis
MRKIKVLHVLTTTAGGLGQSVLSIILGLDPERFDSSVSFGAGYNVDEYFKNKGFRIIPVRMKRGLSLKNILGFWDLCRLIKKERFDIVHAHSSVAGTLARLGAKLYNVPIVLFTLHGYATLDYQKTPLRPFLWVVEKLLDLCTDYYIAICDYVKVTWLKRRIISPDRVTVIYNGVDPELASLSINNEEKRQSLGIPKSSPIVGTIGLLEKRKGTEFLIRSAPKILRLFPECRFIIIGDGPLHNRLVNLAKRSGVLHAFRFLGWRDDANELIGVMDIFCLPSLREGFSIALLEAMAHGKPIITTPVTGNPEAIIDGETGFLVPVKDYNAISAAVLKLLNNPEKAHETGLKAKKRLNENFTVRKMQQGYNHLYLKMIKESGIENV